MKANSFITGLAITFSMLTASCSAGNVNITGGKESDASIHKTVQISDFENISASQGIKVVYSQGKNTGVAKIATTPSAEKYLKVTVKGNTLNVYYDTKDNIPIKGPSIIYVTGETLRGADISSAASLDIATDLNGGKLNIDLSSASSFNSQNITCREIDIDASSSASIKSGIITCEKMEAGISSAATFTVGSLRGNLSLEASSSAKAEFGALIGEKADIEASSTACVSISGIDCTAIKAEASSLAKITLSGTTRHLSRDSSSAAHLDTSGLKVAP